MKSLPRISIITPNFNYERYIEDTIRSVLAQGYPNLDYIVVDDHSTDGSLDVIKKYASRLRYYVNDRNMGQAYSVNRGFAAADGEIFAYLNSDDMFAEGALWTVVREMSKDGVDWLAGRCAVIGEDDKIIYTDMPILRYGFLGWIGGFCHLSQPAVFWTRRAAETAGGFDESLYYALDYDFFARLSGKGFCPRTLKAVLAIEREHRGRKTSLYRSRKDITYHDTMIMSDKLDKLLKEDQRPMLAEIRMRRNMISKIDAGMGSNRSRVYAAADILKIPLRYPSAFWDRSWYGCFKKLLLNRR